jgi:hypothetical protein
MIEPRSSAKMRPRLVRYSFARGADIAAGITGASTKDRDFQKNESE